MSSYISWLDEQGNYQQLDLDVVFSIRPVHAAKTTDSPVEQGLTISDNARRLPIQLDVEFAIKGADEGLDAYKTLTGLQEPATLVDITQDEGVTWSNLYLENLSMPDKLEPKFGRVRFSCKFKEIRMAVVTVTKPPAKAKPTKEVGHKDTVKPSAAMAKLADSYGYKTQTNFMSYAGSHP